MTPFRVSRAFRHPAQHLACRPCVRASLVCGLLAFFVFAPTTASAQLRFIVGGEEQAQRLRPAGAEDRQEWRDTLSDQRNEREGARERRRMSEEERSDLRRHMRDAARGAYREEPGRKPQR